MSAQGSSSFCLSRDFTWPSLANRNLACGSTHRLRALQIAALILPSTRSIGIAYSAPLNGLAKHQERGGSVNYQLIGGLNEPPRLRELRWLREISWSRSHPSFAKLTLVHT